MSKIKVVHVFDTYPMPYAPYFEEVLNRLAKHKGIDSSVFAFNTDDESANPLKFNIGRRIQYKLYSGISSKKEPLFLLELLKNDPDIIHIQISYLYKKFGAALEQLTRSKKVVITLRGGDTYVKPWMVKDLQGFYKKYGSKVSFITMSENQKAYVQQWGVPADRVSVIPISHNNTQREADLGKARDTTVRLVSVYRMTWEKNIQGSMLLIRQLVDMGLNVQYDVYGDGEELGEVYYLKDRMNLHDHVNIKGRVSYKDLMAALPSYHFIVQLSISEALPSSILEAQSMGIPAIISDSGGLPEAVIPGASGISHPFWAINKLAADTCDLWNDKGRYISFCKRAIEHSRNFTAERETEKLVQLYSTIMA